MARTGTRTREGRAAELLRQARELEAKQVRPFEAVVQAYADLWYAHRALQRAGGAGGGAATGTGTGTAAAAAGAGAGAGQHAGEEAGASAARVRELELKLEQMQQDLVAKYKTEARDAASQLALEAELRRLQQAERERTEALERARASLREKAAQLEEESRSAGRAREEATLLRDELLRVRRMLEKAEAQVRSLTKENASLVDRLLTEKVALIEEMNRMTTMYQELQEKYAEVTGNAPTVGGKQPGAGPTPTKKDDQPAPPPSSSTGATGPRPHSTGLAQLGFSGAAAAAAASASAGGGAPPIGNTDDASLDAFVERIPMDPPDAETRAHDSETPALAFDESGGLLVTASCDGTVKTWDAGGSFYAKSTLRTTSPAGSGVAGGLMSFEAFGGGGGGGGGDGGSSALLGVDVKCGLVLAAGSDRAARVWSLSTERVMHTLTGHASKIYACKLTSDGKFAVTGGTDRKAMIWDVHTGFRIRIVNCGSICNAVAIADEGTYFATGHQDKSVRVWDMRVGKSVFASSDTAPVHDGPVTSVKFFPGGLRLLTSAKDDSLCVLDLMVASGAGSTEAKDCVLKRMRCPDYHAAFNWSGADVSPSAALVAAGGANGKVYVWRVDGGGGGGGGGKADATTIPDATAVLSGGGKAPIESVAWSPMGGGRLAAVDKEGYLRHWRWRSSGESGAAAAAASASSRGGGGGGGGGGRR